MCVCGGGGLDYFTGVMLPWQLLSRTLAGPPGLDRVGRSRSGFPSYHKDSDNTCTSGGNEIFSIRFHLCYRVR